MRWNGLALLMNAPPRFSSERGGVRLNVPDWLPALVNGARALVAIGAAELFWVFSAWPTGSFAILFTAITVLLLSPMGDRAYGASIVLSLGTAFAVVGTAVIKFAVLPAFGSFPAFSIALGLYLIPIGFAAVYPQAARDRRGARRNVFPVSAAARSNE